MPQEEPRQPHALAQEPGTRRAALAALLASTALGLGSAGHAIQQSAQASEETKRRRRNRKRKDHGKHQAGGATPAMQYVERTVVTDANGIFSSFAECPEGFLPIGAGFFTAVPNPNVIGSFPNSATRRWTIEINGSVQGVEFTTAAVCLAGSDETAEQKSGDRLPRKKDRKQKP